MGFRPFVFLLTILFLPSLIVADEASKLPVPDEAAQTKALDLVKEVYKSDYESARTNEQKAALAKKMLKDSVPTKDATNRYVLLRVAKDIAAQAGDVYTAFAATSQLEQGYEVDGLMMKAAAVAAASKEAKLPNHHQAIAPYFLQLVDQAVAADRYDLANKIGDVALESARKARSSDIVKEIVATQKRVDELESAFAEVQAALEVLKEKPSDPDANLFVGKFRCFMKEDWDASIPILALGSDEKLKALAAEELADEPDPLELGDGWWDVAEELEESAKTAARRRAADWYRKALPGLEGLTKRKVEGRVQESDENGPFAEFAGTWIIVYKTSGRRYTIDPFGNVVHGERRCKLRRIGQGALIDFGDNKLERIQRRGAELSLEHFSPASSYPENPLPGKGHRLALVSELSGDQLKQIAGKWIVNYSHGHNRTYTFDETGSVAYGKLRGKLRVRNGELVLDFGDGKLERLELRGQHIFIEHFSPATYYPHTYGVYGIAQKQ